jgi:hypothetical protein
MNAMQRPAGGPGSALEFAPECIAVAHVLQDSLINNWPINNFYLYFNYY